ncbi:hypothetical protein F4811DRAFT_554786 [Daldinia bambusicola]|nr:hypothetical protein F4811DRAFT_554786 [Daldinia bambusicola]
MGTELAQALGAKNAKVYLTCRTEEKGLETIEEIKRADPASKGELVFLHLNQMLDIDLLASRRDEIGLDSLIETMQDLAEFAVNKMPSLLVPNVTVLSAAPAVGEDDDDRPQLPERGPLASPDLPSASETARREHASRRSRLCSSGRDRVIPFDQLDSIGLEATEHGPFVALPIREWVSRALAAGLHPAVAALVELMDDPDQRDYPKLLKVVPKT